MKDSAVVLEEESASEAVFSSEVDNGPIDEMCELQGKSICNGKYILVTHRKTFPRWNLQ